MHRLNQVMTARWIVPVTSDPINGGWIQICGNRVVQVGKGSPPSKAVDLGDVALLPRLINAHTHLEFSDRERPIGQPGMSLPHWIREVIASRSSVSLEERNNAISLGIRRSIEFGTQLIGEIATPPCDYPIPTVKPTNGEAQPEVASTDSGGGDSSLEIIAFAEVLGLSPSRASERLDAAIEHNRQYPFGGLSPHAPYSTTGETVQRCVNWARKLNRPVAMHVAESKEERELLCRGSGPFAEVFHELGVWQDGLFPWPGDPVCDLIDRLAQSPRALLIHGNDLNDREIDRLTRHNHLTVVYCPRTHTFFEHDRHPVATLLSANVRVALGTDSLASNPDLSVWREAQHLLNHRGDLTPRDVIAMATRAGADAFGRSDLGRIEIGSRSEFGFIRSAAQTVDALYRDMAHQPYQPLRHTID